MLPDLLTGHQGAHLVVRAGGRVILDGPQAVLASNNPYQTGDIAGLGRRARLDQGVLGAVGVKVENAAQAAGRSPRAPAADGLGAATPPGPHVRAGRGWHPRGTEGNTMTALTSAEQCTRDTASRKPRAVITGSKP